MFCFYLGGVQGGEKMGTRTSAGAAYYSTQRAHLSEISEHHCLSEKNIGVGVKKPGS